MLVKKLMRLWRVKKYARQAKHKQRDMTLNEALKAWGWDD